MKIIYNEAIDFICALTRFGLRNVKKDPDYPEQKEIEQWYSEYEKKVSPFLLNDIALLSERTIMITFYFLIKIHKNPEIQTTNDFLNYLDSLNAEDLKNDIISDIFRGIKTELSVENIYNLIVDEGLHPDHNHMEEAEFIYSVLQDPENFLARLKITYSQFYNQIFKESKKTYEDLIKKKLEWHNQRFADDAKSYLYTLGLKSIIGALKDLESISYYFSFFADNDVSASWDSRLIIIGAGTDSRIIQQSAKSKSNLFFSCLGDPKRLEIMRLTSQRTWYSTELANYFNLKPATLSYHINKLVEADLLTISQGENKRFYYSLNKDSIEEYLKFVSQDLLGV
ncbi:MAG: ArsR/SmtB family transcription factor [Pleomorphochaeta sp.]